MLNSFAQKIEYAGLYKTQVTLIVVKRKTIFTCSVAYLFVTGKII